MSLFNSKEPEKSIKPQQATTERPQRDAIQATPVAPTAAPIVLENKAAASPTPPSRPTSSAASASDARAYLDAGSRISGKLYFDTPARIDGQVEGEIAAKELLTIGESAVVAAQIKAATVIVAGKVSGDIVANQRIEIRPSAKVLGNVTAPTLVIHEGALFEGHCTMAAEVMDDRKVTVFPKEERMAQAAGSKP